MKKRDLKISFGKSGSGSISPKLSIPKSFLDKIGVTQEEREIEIEVNENTQEIIIRKKIKKSLTTNDTNDIISLSNDTR